MIEASARSPGATHWLIRIPGSFAAWSGEICSLTGCKAAPLGPDYHLLRTPDPDCFRNSGAGPFISWNLPVHHSWPCHPPKMENFIEKAAQTLVKKFGPFHPQAIHMGPLQSGTPDRYYKSLASNLRGRTLQLFPGLSGAAPAESQDPDKPTLFCLVGREGLFAGLQSPRKSNGFHPGGTKFISQAAAGTISRAGAKIAEALHYLLLHRPLPATGSHWLELGASPGGMTSELLNRNYRVTAIDRAPLDGRLANSPGLTFSKADVATFTPPQGTIYDALLCDMNGDSHQSLRHVTRLAKYLGPDAPIIFTLKTPGSETFPSLLQLIPQTIRAAASGGLNLIALTHLTYNRLEFTCFFERAR